MNRWRTYPLPTLFVFPQPLLDYLRHFYSTKTQSLRTIFTLPPSPRMSIHPSVNYQYLKFPCPEDLTLPLLKPRVQPRPQKKDIMVGGLGWVSTTLQFPRKKGFDTKCADIRNRAPTLVVPFMLSSTIGSCIQATISQA